MKAIHVNSFVPFFAKKGLKPTGTELKNIVSGGSPVDKFELYNIVLSALTWRKYNGEIDLVCDKASALYYEEVGITAIWNNVRQALPDEVEGINPLMFWAAGKLLALRETPSPVVMLDMDFIVWKRLELKNTIVAAHRENLSPRIYPDISRFKMKKGYIFNKDFNYSALPLNTAFLYLPDEDFKQFYVGNSLDFMKSAIDNPDFLCYMVYAEQRLLSMCAEHLNARVETLLDKDRLFFPQDDFTHLWGAKQVMRDNKKEEETFCARCAKRIRKDFPDFAYVIDLIEKT
ncbi:MAG: hypothetical protein FWH08_03540 [Oscillospiraceae bacterium]|nr:hypothetical protein [Oscillospiraceae bacterium]